MCLTKTYDHKMSFDDSYSYNTLACNGPETMFSPYVSIFSDTDDEQQHAKHRCSLYLYEVSAAIFIDYFQSTWL